MPLRRLRQPCYANPGGHNSTARLISGIADQRLTRPEQDHQQDTDHAQHGENRLLQQHFEDAVPEPGRVALDPGLERSLAGLVNVVPELTELGEAQGLIGYSRD